jgi:aminoglycoside 6'-N-acetyltransferase I
VSGETVLGWAGAIAPPHYHGHAWELHPLVVAPSHQGRGIGRRLTQAIEAEARHRGVQTLYLGTDDENNLTSLGGESLFPDPLAALSTLKNLRAHPFGFYQKLGFTVVGVLPNVNGPGKHDIFMAKPVLPVGPRSH